MNIDRWNETVEFELEHHAQRASDSEEAIPMLCLWLRNNPMTGEPLEELQAFIIGTEFVGDNDKEVEESKDAFYAQARMIAMAGRAIAAAFSSEVWMLKQVKVGSPDIMPRPSRHPDRVEGILVRLEHEEHGMQIHFGEIRRDGEARRVDGFEQLPCEQVGGKLSSFVPPPHLVDDPTAIEVARMLVGQMELQFHD